MDIQFDLNGLASTQRRFKKHNGCSREPMCAELEKRVMTLAKDDRLLRRVVSAYFRDEANNAEKIFAKHVVDYNENGADFDWAVPKRRQLIPIMRQELWGEVDASKKMSIVKLFADEDRELLAKYRYFPKSDKLSLIR